MNELSEAQVALLQNGSAKPLGLIHPHTKEEYVLLRRDVYERLRTVLDDFTPADALAAQLEAAAAAGWDDPALDIYNELDTPGKAK